mmetsp:Transcript_3872/g.9881  ORF Transcript_3872/g.9881 Transcript_3872/m.9881 type:complete len:84 (+) Transcript_3872:367-618(+)
MTAPLGIPWTIAIEGVSESSMAKKKKERRAFPRGMPMRVRTLPTNLPRDLKLFSCYGTMRMTMRDVAVSIDRNDGKHKGWRLH